MHKQSTTNSEKARESSYFIMSYSIRLPKTKYIAGTSGMPRKGPLHSPSLCSHQLWVYSTQKIPRLKKLAHITTSHKGAYFVRWFCTIIDFGTDSTVVQRDAPYPPHTPCWMGNGSINVQTYVASIGTRLGFGCSGDRLCLDSCNLEVGYSNISTAKESSPFKPQIYTIASRNWRWNA